MTRILIVLVWGLFVATDVSAGECETCHAEKTPGVTTVWQGSSHAEAGVGCEACHGSDHDLTQPRPIVDAAKCGTCHKQEYEEHHTSRHGMGLHSGWGCTRNMLNRDRSECIFCHDKESALPQSQVMCARFLKQSSAMGELGCNRCHEVENNCGSCHSSHSTDLSIVRSPKTCAKCHMGPDHPQWEMWETSQHGTLSMTRPDLAPDCLDCHMANGSHMVSFGITKTPAGKDLGEAVSATRRTEMLDLCSTCHARGFSERELNRADQIWQEQQALVNQAKEIVEDLYDRGILDPMPKDRPPHPLAGTQLVLDGQMLYEDISHIERLFFKMKKYDFAKAFKGAYHQNPAYTHWYGNAEVKMTLEDIKAEASRLKRAGKGSAAPVVETDRLQSAEEKLDYLKKRFLRGAISRDEYDRERRLLLDAMLPQR